MKCFLENLLFYFHLRKQKIKEIKLMALVLPLSESGVRNRPMAVLGFFVEGPLFLSFSQ